MLHQVLSAQDQNDAFSNGQGVRIIGTETGRYPGLLDGFLASTRLDLTPFCSPNP